MSIDTPLQQLERGTAVLLEQGMPIFSQDCNTALLAYVALLSKWSRVYNLTAVRDAANMIDRHVLDSLALSCWLPAAQASQEDAIDTPYDLMDIGSGAGLPVLPLAIIRPDLRFLSVESNGKKTRFQQQVLLELGMQNVDIRHARIQNVTESADLIVSRAFTAPQEFLDIAYSRCAREGRVAVMLGAADRMPDEIGPSYRLEEFKKLVIPGADSVRHVAVCRRLPG